MSRRIVALVALVVAVTAPAAPARAAPVSGAELRELAERAAGGDGAALARLRTVDAVDGRPVDLGRALEGDDGAARAQALAASLGSAPSPGAAGGDPSAAAREVLEDGRYHESALPRPFRRPLRWLGDRVRPVVEAVRDAFDELARWIPGGRVVAWLVVIALFAAVIALLTRSAIHRRAAAAAAEAQARRREHAIDPAALERAAADAERAGDWETAVRLRFRAGVARLQEGRRVQDAPALTTGELAEALRSPQFDALGRRFDAIAYGGDPAGEEDAAAAREGWPRVLEESRR